MSKIENEAIEQVSEILKNEIFYFNEVECVALSDTEQCYIQGYKNAVDKACEWLKEHKNDYAFPIYQGYVSDDIIKDIRKAMEE